ncbi:MAG: methionine adenosyltransferase [Patescibacteria group bacterium]
MFNRSKNHTVESVTSGHPDKICDQVSDAILDACLEQDPTSRVAIECLGAHGLFVIGGEVTTGANFDAEKIAHDLYREIGYEDELKIVTNIVKQSSDIAQGVDTGGAGDQGIMYGYATNETPEFLPKAIVLAHQLTKGLEGLRRSGEISWLRPDGKAQATMANGEIRTILVSCQHNERVKQEQIRQELIEKLIQPLIGESSDWVEIIVNPTGQFVQGGFAADTGVTGRKIMVDTYGGLIPHGGGAFSGKDPTKVDRSAAYMGRFAARKLVEEGLAKEALVSVAYAIGRAEPVMIEAANEKGEDFSDYVKKNFDFRPLAIIERLDLRRPIYRQTASYGHMGRDFPWG